MNHTIWPDTAEVVAGRLVIGGCDTRELAERYGTPLYLLDAATVRASCAAYRAAFARYPGAVRIHYASKAWLNSAIVRLIAEAGMGLDIVSGGELFIARRAGFDPAAMHLHGNAKPRAELEQALEANIGQIVVDNLDELALLAELTAGRSAPQPIGLRLAPDVAATTHAHIQTGLANSKFGLTLSMLDAAAAILARAPGLRCHALHCHLGSQLFEQEPYAIAIGVLLDAAQLLARRHGITIDEINSGGGLGVRYTADQPAPDLDAYAAAVCAALAAGVAARGLPPMTLAIEPGRSIIARSTVALYTIISSKRASPELPRYLHIDGGMADNIRPPLYGARYTVLHAGRAADDAEETVTISGRYCESGDILFRDVPLPQAAIGDLLAVAGCGAYTLSMASNYNGVPRPAVVQLEAGRARLVQRRESYEDLVARDADGDD